jgi:hypothetical protein
MASSIIRKTNIQGDIWLVTLRILRLACKSLTIHSFSRPGLPKRFQSFLFFQIHKPTEFKERLRRFIDDSKITTAARACEMKDEIAAAKGKTGDKAPLLPLPGINIAFASTGLHKVSDPQRPQLAMFRITDGFPFATAWKIRADL